MECPEILKWVDMQSIISMSIALNAAYFSISSYITPYAQDQRALILVIFKGLGKVTHADKKEALRTQLEALSRNVGEREKKDKTFYLRLRTASVLLFVFGIILLWKATIDAHQPVNVWLARASIALCIPFLWGIFHMIFISSTSFNEISRKRFDIQIALNRAILDK